MVSRRASTGALALGADRLSDLRPGSTALVGELGVGLSDDCRLRELGFFEGAEVKVLLQGDPVVVQVAGARYALSRRCATRVGLQVPSDSQAR